MQVRELHEADARPAPLDWFMSRVCGDAQLDAREKQRVLDQAAAGLAHRADENSESFEPDSASKRERREIDSYERS